MELDPYIADGEQAKETLEAIRVALVGLEPGTPIHFLSSGSDWVVAWHEWLNSQFMEVIGPYLVEVRTLVGKMALREVIELEDKLSAQFESNEYDRSLSAGRVLKERIEGARHRPELDKLLNAEAGDCETSRHFVTLFAARCASHHISLAATLAAYLYFELSSGAKDAEGEIPSPRLMLPLVLPTVRQILDSQPPFNYQVA